MTPQQKRIAGLEDALKDRERRFDDLKAEHDKQAELIAEMKDQLEECSAQIERWIEAFDMELGDDGWHWQPWIDRHNEVFAAHRDLIAKWNKFTGRYNARIAPRNTGRPLAASDVQRQRILNLHKAGRSLRWIAEETNLGLQTVRTVIDKKDGVDRATLGRLERIAPDRARQVRDQRSIRDIKGLPKRINANLERNAELRKAAKGLL